MCMLIVNNLYTDTLWKQQLQLLLIHCFTPPPLSPDALTAPNSDMNHMTICQLFVDNLETISLRDGNYLIFKDAPKIETIKAGLKYIDINVLRRFSVILHCNGISSHFNIRRSLSSDSYINKSTAKHFTNLGRETFVYLLSPNLSISQGT